ncbi:MAG: hypothetical protein Q4E57_01565 [Eubacteriales bacterium]|nr:hypothetical protein [Eubacteriales bacterium]
MARDKKSYKTEKGGSRIYEQMNQYYELHSKSVDDLVTADVSNSPVVSKEELRKYKSSKIELPDWFKVIFAKFWFPAAVCYFFFWGLGTYVRNMLDMLFISGLAMGIVTDMLVNNLLRFMADTEGKYDKFMMFPQKGYWTYPLNIIYAWFLLFLVFTMYSVVNRSILFITKATDTLPLGIEPVFFGIFYLAADMLMIGAKNLLKSIITDAVSKSRKA